MIVLHVLSKVFLGCETSVVVDATLSLTPIPSMLLLMTFPFTEGHESLARRHLTKQIPAHIDILSIKLP